MRQLGPSASVVECTSLCTERTFKPTYTQEHACTWHLPFVSYPYQDNDRKYASAHKCGWPLAPCMLLPHPGRRSLVRSLACPNRQKTTRSFLVLPTITEPIGYTWSYLACRIGQLLPVWQPLIGPSFQYDSPKALGLPTGNK
jgi:hypothetical protein